MELRVESDSLNLPLSRFTFTFLLALLPGSPGALGHLPRAHPLSTKWSPDALPGHWLSPRAESITAVLEVWERGGELTAVSDGTLVRARRGGGREEGRDIEHRKIEIYTSV